MNGHIPPSRQIARRGCFVATRTFHQRLREWPAAEMEVVGLDPVEGTRLG